MQEHDTRTISTFEKYIIGMNVLTQAQVDGAKEVQKALAERGVRKSLEEIALLKGLLDSDQMGGLLADIKAKWKISIPRPVLYSITDEKDRALQEQLVQQSPKHASQVLECRKIQQEVQALGIGFKVSELLIAKGYYTPPAPAGAAPAGPKAEPSIEDLLPDLPPIPKKPTVLAPPPRKPQAAAGPRKPVSPVRPAPRAGARGTEEEEPAPPKKNKLVLWGAIGGAAALVLVVIVVVIATSGSEPPPPPPAAAPKPKGKQIVLKLEGVERVPVYSEEVLLEMHAVENPQKPVLADLHIPVNTPVTLLRQLRTNRNLWFLVRTAKGTEGWVVHTAIEVINGDLRDEGVADYLSEWSEKIAAKKGEPAKPAPVARVPEGSKPPEPAKPAVVEPARPAEPAKPAEPEPARPADPAPAETTLVAHWPLDEGSGTGAADASARSAAAQVSGALWGPGAVGKALGFDGADDYVSCPATGMPAANAPQTIAGWYAVSAVPPGVQTMVLLEGASSSVQVGFRNSKIAAWKHGGTVLVSADPPPDARSPAQGLLGVYYSRPNLTQPSLQRYDPQVSFDWGQGAPDAGMPPDNFSVRWKGFVEPLHSETYTFYALTDDGVRLWVDGKPVFDNWGPQMPTETKGTIALKAKTKVEIVLEYFENNGGALARLSWSSPSQAKQIIPADRFSPPPTAWHHFAYTFDGATHRLYVDGGLRNASNVAPGTEPVTKVELGRWEGKGPGPKEYFKGMLDDVRIYTGALTQEQVKNLAPDAGIAMAAPGRPSPAGGPAAGPRPPPLPPDPKQGEREAKAQALWDAALDYENQGRFADAQTALRSLRTRFRTTRVYLDRSIEISDKINEFGLKLAAAAIAKTALYKKAHMDSWYSYEFLPPLDWKGVPPQPNWFGEQDNDETYLRGKTYQVARYTAPYLDKLYMVVLKTFACDSMENLQSKVTGTVETRMKGLKEDASTPSSGKMPFVRKTYSTPAGDRAVIYYYFQDRRGLALLCTWRAGGSEDFGVSITIIDSTGTTTMKSKEHPVSDESWASALKVFDQCARTFWIYDAATRQGKQVQLDRSALCADWNILRSAKGWYVIEYATKPEFAKRAGEEMEQIMALYKQVLPTQKAIPPCRIKLFDREDDFQYYSGAYGAAAYWSPGQEEIVAYRFEGDKLKVDSKEEFTIAEDKNPEDVTFKILYHEGFHQYMHFSMGRDRGVYVPSWVNEGLGDYFFGGDWSKDRRKFSIGLNDWRLKKIHEAVKKGEHVGLDKIFRYEQMQYYTNASLCYAEGWAINYFFQQSEVARKKGYHLIPQRMIQELKTSGNWEKATDKVFAGVDLKKMEEEWKEFVLALPVPKEAEVK